MTALTALLLKLGPLLLQLGPVFAQTVAAIKAAGGASEADLAKLDAMIEVMDSQRVASWAAADAALEGRITNP